MGYNILITGANRGLGLALTEKLLAGGHHIYAINRRDSDELLQLQEKYPESLHRYSGDVTDESFHPAGAGSDSQSGRSTRHRSEQRRRTSGPVSFVIGAG